MKRLLNRYPFVAQKDSEDCGLACLAMIFRYYVGSISFDSVEKICNFSNQGISLKGLLVAARTLGFQSTAFLATCKYLTSSTTFPLISFINNNHYVVIYSIYKKWKYNKDYIVVGDPAYGIITYEFSEFIDKWYHGNQKGILIRLTPTNNSRKYIDKKINIRKKIKIFSSYFKKNRYSTLYVIFCLLIISVIQIILPFLTQNIIDKAIGKKDINYLWMILIAQLSLIVGKSLIDITRSQIVLHMNSEFSVKLISSFLKKLLKLPMAFFERRKIGDLIQRMEDNSRLVTFLTTDFISLSVSIIGFIISALILGYYNINIFWIYIICLFIYVCWTSLFLKKRKKLDYEYFDQNSSESNVMYQLFDSIEEIKLQGCSNKKQLVFENIYIYGRKIEIKRLNLFQINRIGALLINQGRDIFITVLVSLFVINGQLTLGVLLAVQYIIGQLESPVDEIVNFLYKWQDMSIGIDRINLIYKEKDEATPTQIYISPKEVSQDITVHDVYFKYDLYSTNYVLKNISLVIPHNKVTAIVGLSGSGKTTLLKLILGYYQPNKGSIFVGNKSLNDINMDSWRSRCGVVMQDGYIFSDSIEGNIVIADKGKVDPKKLDEAARLSKIDDIISKMPLKYKTQIGKDGHGLSKGQMQRILIARVIYKNPNYIFLDEATNSLDAKNEKEITSNLEHFFNGKTVLIIAHRISTVRNANQIVVLEEGQIKEIGNHNELINKKGKYYELVNNQLEI